MENNKCIFKLSPYDINGLLPQVSKALEKRTELVSRERYPGLVKPQELLVPLLVGAVAIGAGIGGLWRSRKHKKNPFDKSAKLLLAGGAPEEFCAFCAEKVQNYQAV